MKKLMISFSVIFISLTTILAQKGPNWTAPNANDKNIGIHHDNVPIQSNTNTNSNSNTNNNYTPPQNQTNVQLPQYLPLDNFNINNSSTWQLNGWDNLGAYTIHLKYTVNGLLQVTIQRPYTMPQSYNSTWSYVNGILYSNNCSWFSQGRFLLDASGWNMTFFSVWNPNAPVFLQRIT